MPLHLVSPYTIITSIQECHVLRDYIFVEVGITFETTCLQEVVKIDLIAVKFNLEIANI